MRSAQENLGFVQAPEPEVTWEKLGRGKGQAFPHVAAWKDKWWASRAVSRTRVEATSRKRTGGQVMAE